MRTPGFVDKYSQHPDENKLVNSRMNIAYDHVMINTNTVIASINLLCNVQNLVNYALQFIENNGAMQPL